MHYLLDDHNNDIGVTVTLSEDLLIDIVTLAERQGLEPQVLIRMSIARYLERNSDYMDAISMKGKLNIGTQQYWQH